MFDSGISARDLIENIKGEVDVALPIPNASYVMWLNSLEYMLYSSVIKEQKKISLNHYQGDTIILSELPILSNEAQIRFDDIYISSMNTLYNNEAKSIEQSKEVLNITGKVLPATLI